MKGAYLKDMTNHYKRLYNRIYRAKAGITREKNLDKAYREVINLKSLGYITYAEKLKLLTMINKNIDKPIKK